MIYQISIEEARACLGDLVTLVYWTGEEVLITRAGYPQVRVSQIKTSDIVKDAHTLTRKLIKEMSRAPVSK